MLYDQFKDGNAVRSIIILILPIALVLPAPDVLQVDLLCGGEPLFERIGPLLEHGVPLHKPLQLLLLRVRLLFNVVN